MAVAIHPYYFSVRKRIFDVLVSSALLIITLPLMLIISCSLLTLNGRPILFRQQRLGKDKKPFSIYKFRSMYVGAEKNQFRYRSANEAPAPMFKISADPRFVRLGRFLSRSGLDELPQLLNILKGDMSLVGPRPLPVKEAEALDKSWGFRFLVKPGIFSEWSASSKGHDSLEMWKRLEEETLRRGSSKLSLIIILKTFARQGLLLKKVFPN